MQRKIRIGMVGGGKGAFIGAVHRLAATLDGEAEIVAGALSSTPEKSRESGRDLGLAEDRSYGTWREMLDGERLRGEGDRIDVVSIVTPNDTHFAPALAAIEAGFHVVCDKPLTPTSAEAEKLATAAAKAGRIFAVTYNYTGYPMVRQAAAMVRGGELGAVRKVVVEYHQGWLASDLERSGQKQAAWRTDPARSGGAGALGDIGSHAENLVSFVTGLSISEVAAEVSTFVPGRRVDDDAVVLLRFGGGNGVPARGVLSVSQVCVGEENNLTLRIYGQNGSLWWRQEEPNQLEAADAQGVKRVITRGGPGAGPAAAAATRIPGGHPEGFLEAFANIYRGVFAAVRGGEGVFPSAADGVRGVRFIEGVLESGRKGGAWVGL